MAAPKTPKQLTREYLRYVDPTDPTKVIELDLADTGRTAPDGTRIFAQKVVADVDIVTTTSLETILEEATLAASASINGDSTDLSDATGGLITIAVTFHGSATVGITVDLHSSYDNATWDTVPWVPDIEPTLNAGASIQASIPIDTLPKYFRATVVNADPTYAVTNLKITLTRKG